MFGYISKKAHEAAMAEKDLLIDQWMKSYDRQVVEKVKAFEQRDQFKHELDQLRAIRAKSNGNLIPGGAKGKGAGK